MPAWLHELLYTLSGAALLSCGLSAWLAVSEANERGGDPTLAGTAGIAAVVLLIVTAILAAAAYFPKWS